MARQSSDNLDVQLPHLETFARAAELSSFTAAARTLGLTQAAVSQRVHALEQVLDVPLFDRQGGRVLLSQAGQRLYDYAQRILALHREALREIAGRDVPLTGVLSLAASSIPGEYLLPDLLARFRDRHPHVQVRATIADTGQVLQQVEHGEAQLGLVGGKGEQQHLVYRTFAEDELALLVPAGHPHARRRSLSLAQLLAEPLILREQGSASRQCFEQALTKVGKSLADVHVVLELGSNEAIKEAVRRNLGVAVLSTHAAKAEIEGGQLRSLAIAGLALTRPIFVTWDQRRVLPIPARQFLDLIAPS
jgi:LysR family transcriptional regulator, low CO2-responsive transcriptional regulator